VVQDSGVDWEAEMNVGKRQSLLGGHEGRSVVGDDGSPGAFYRSEDGHERGREGDAPSGDGGSSMRQLRS
jgi:hypothetical protein